MFDRAVLARSALEVAPLLLGATVRCDGVTVRLTEVEAYLGAEDPGSHAFRGETPRNAPMFGEAGHLYCYFTYGMHTCANVTTGPAGSAQAVLLRAGEIVDGIDIARSRRLTSRDLRDLARGPARLTVALGIRLDDTGADLVGGHIELELPRTPVDFVSGPRTGVSGPGGGPEYPWRFWIPGEPSVSPYKASALRRN